ncbi:uncharacterized protein [Pseudochaenichthys georgianus]|uniref:uncharacterized protein n=1 Tax=Pseudochaenichthys georgianus TaxID=52239 RepID=UPI00146E6A3B|nr:uncharacterized protein LOC117443630 [Pseudochaenichthys georgianus]
MSTYISELQVSLNEAEEINLQKRGFEIIDGNLNQGAGGNDIRLWYKRGPVAITKVQVSFNEEMVDGLNRAGYTPIKTDLNAGAWGDYLYLWFFQGCGEFDTPIVDISVTTDAADEAGKFAGGWERVACDLNRDTAGNLIHVWLKREKKTYICDVTATDSYGSDMDLFEKGYIRVDEDTNRGTGGAFAFIWFRQTTDLKKAIKEIQVSIKEDQHLEFQQQHYQLVDVDLNKGTGGNKVFLWHKKTSDPIKAIGLLLNKDVVEDNQEAGISVIQKNLNEGTQGSVEYLYVNL